MSEAWESDTRILEVYNSLKVKALIKKVTVTDVLYIIVEAMILIEKIRGLTGSQKKEFVISIVTKLCKDQGISGPEVETVINIVAPIFIELIISATNGLMNLNKEKIKGCFTKCCK